MTTKTPPIDVRSNLTAQEICELAARQAAALDEDPFELIGHASIAASSLGGDLDEHLHELAQHDPRLRPVLATIVGALPMIAEHAPPIEASPPSPEWLKRLGEARITGAMRRPEQLGPADVGFLLEVAIPSALTTTAVIRLGNCGDSFVVKDLHTAAVPMTEVADWEQMKYQWTNPHCYQPVDVNEAVGVIRRALVRWMIHDCARGEETRPFPGWPLTAPELAWIVGLEAAEPQTPAA